MSARIVAPVLLIIATTTAWPADTIHQAAARGDLAAVEALLVDGADPDARDQDDRTPLQMAAHSGHVEVARLLLAAGADPSALDSDHGKAPLHAAAEQGQPEMVRLLLDRGADPNGRAIYAPSAEGAAGPAGPTPLTLLAPPGQTPLHVATRMAGSD